MIWKFAPRFTYDKPEDPAADPAPRPRATPADEMFSGTYVKELRAEAKLFRTRAREAEAAKEAAQRERDAEKARADAAQAEADKKVTQRLIRAELKAAAIKAGIVDLDGLAFVDYEKLKLKDDGTIEGADEQLAALKEKKPYLFGTQGTTTGPKPPSPSDPKVVDVRKMSTAEYAEHKRSLGLR